MGLDAGTLTLSRSGSGVTVTGVSGPVLGAALADVIVVPAKDADATAWLVLPGMPWTWTNSPATT